jgi:bifunctional non-homologous end joining protein LigD
MTIANPPAGPGWLHEIKYDGFRMLARREDEHVRLFTRNANDWTERYPLVVGPLPSSKKEAPLQGARVHCAVPGHSPEVRPSCRDCTASAYFDSRLRQH